MIFGQIGTKELKWSFKHMLFVWIYGSTQKSFTPLVCPLVFSRTLSGWTKMLKRPPKLKRVAGTALGSMLIFS